MYLENIYSPADVKKLPVKELNELSDEIRVSLLQKLSEHGGHFGPNFGMVEATIALHYVFNSPKDKIVFDVSHQSYVHKMLTGRKNAFLHPEEYNLVSGYTEPQESEHDFFVIGHTKTLTNQITILRSIMRRAGTNIVFSVVEEVIRTLRTFLPRSMERNSIIKTRFAVAIHLIDSGSSYFSLFTGTIRPASITFIYIFRESLF